MTAWTCELFECRVPLRRELDFGDYRLAHRDYTILRLRDADGVEGVAWGYNRGADIAGAFRRQVEPLLAGVTAAGATGWEKIYHAHAWTNQGGVFLRALSLADIALWQWQAARTGGTLREALGAKPAPPAAASVASCYDTRGRTPADDAAEAQGLVRQGYRALKVCASDGGKRDSARLRAVREAVGPDVALMIDLHWLWKSADDYAAVAREWEPLNLAWIEDAFVADRWAEAVRLKRRCPLPLAWGDEQSGRLVHERWIESGALDVLRLDATVCGGLTEFLRVGRLANAAGLVVSAHLFEEIHAPALAMLDRATGPERFDPAGGLDPIGALRHGEAAAAAWNWDAVARHRFSP